MKDMMMIVYNALIADPYIKGKASGRIKFYEYPPTGDISGPYIVIDSLSPPLPADFGDDDPITDEYLYQIDVWTKDRMLTKELAKHVQSVMRGLGFGAYGGATDEWDPDTRIYRDARRYRGRTYVEEVEAFV